MRLCFLCLFGLTKDEIHLLQWILWNRDYISRTVLDEIDAFTRIREGRWKIKLAPTFVLAFSHIDRWTTSSLIVRNVSCRRFALGNDAA
jgi:hypothetical protein